jgi:predicted acetyltransferase
VAYKKNDIIQGYLVYEFKPKDDKSILVNDIVVNDLVYENREALEEIMTFLNSQSDQIRFVIFNIQDEDFRFILDDPRNDSDNMFVPVCHECSIQGTGIMYRVINTRALFKELEEHVFNNENCKLKITIEDSLLKENEGSIIVNFENGLATISNKEDYEVEIALNIADFSSLITCAVSFKSLYKYGRAQISNKEYINAVNNIFCSEEKPVCFTRF